MAQREQIPWRQSVATMAKLLAWPLGMVAAALVLGTLGFLVIGGGRWSLLQCLYMTSITLTTVGYGEVLPEMGRSGQVFAMVLMWLGMGVVLYAISNVTAFIVERRFSRIFQERKMAKQIAGLKGHYILCGLGETGRQVMRELLATGHQVVAIDQDAARLERAQSLMGEVPAIEGSAQEEEVLLRAGIERATGIIAALDDDGHNLIITLQARYLNPRIKIGVRCNRTELADKYRRAGANHVISPYFIGGMRLASEMIRPQVVAFLDRMLRGKDQVVRVEEVEVCDGSPLQDQSLEQADIWKRTGLVPIALKPPQGQDFIYNPGPEEKLTAGTVLIVIGEPGQVAKLGSMCS